MNEASGVAAQATPTKQLAPDDLSLVTIALLRGPVTRESDEKLWSVLTKIEHRVADYVGVLGLRLMLDESDGYAFLRSAREDEVEAEFPRLVNRHRLSFHVSLLIALLRKRLAEFDATSSDARLMLTREQITDLMRTYVPDSSDDVKLRRKIDEHISAVEKLGFLKRLRGDYEAYEVRRIIRAFVDGQWLSDFDRRLAEYVDQAGYGEVAES